MMCAHGLWSHAACKPCRLASLVWQPHPGIKPGALACRAVAFTALNAQSSRSHGIVMLTIIKRPSSTPKHRAVGQKVKIGKLFMVDLAGSERLKKSRSTGG